MARLSKVSPTKGLIQNVDFIKVLIRNTIKKKFNDEHDIIRDIRLSIEGNQELKKIHLSVRDCNVGVC